MFCFVISSTVSKAQDQAIVYYYFGWTTEKVAYRDIDYKSIRGKWTVLDAKKTCKSLEYDLTPSPFSEYGVKVFKRLYDSLCHQHADYCNEIKFKSLAVDLNPLHELKIESYYPQLLMPCGMVRVKMKKKTRIRL